jgi:hypothetical protein
VSTADDVKNFDEDFIEFFAESCQKDLRQDAPTVRRLRGWLVSVGAHGLSQFACLPDVVEGLGKLQEEENVCESYRMKRVRLGLSSCFSWISWALTMRMLLTDRSDRDLPVGERREGARRWSKDQVGSSGTVRLLRSLCRPPR